MTEQPHLIQGSTGLWETVIGLEVHAQVTSKAKLFSGASATYGGSPNAQVSLVDAAFPGMLPVLNGFCVEQAVRTGLGLNAQINLTSVFERKNYFYADLPAGYQISQYEHPIVGRGEIIINLDDTTTRKIGITRLHLEQDAGKSLHDQRPDATLVDLNRAGIALMEIVSEPDLRTAEETAAYLRKLRAILRCLGTCDGNMEEGSMRCDVNLSVRRVGDRKLGTRCEIKNVNSIRFVMQAIAYEGKRQVDVLENGGKIAQETRLWDTGRGETRSMRSKEEAHDYRYFPDPDLLPLHLDANWVENLRADLPELPDAREARFQTQYGLKPYDAAVLVADMANADYFEEVARGRDSRLAVTWVTSELFGALNAKGASISDSPVSSDALGELLDLIADGTLSGRLAKEVFAAMIETGKAASALVEERGLRQVTDTSALSTVIDEILTNNPDNVAAYRSGKDKLFGFFVGQVMKSTGGKANPALVNQILKEKLTA